MAVWKADLIFECRGRGWEETYYADFGVASFDLVGTIMTSLAQKRAALSAPPVVIKAFRVSDPLTPGRQGKVYYYRPEAAAPGDPAWGTTGATDPSTAVNVGWFRVTGNLTRRIQMRGCPDAIMDNYGQLSGPAFGRWDQLYQQWKLFVLAQPRFGWLNRPTIADPTTVSYSLAPDPIVPIFTTTADFFPADDVTRKRYVRISGLNSGKSPLNGEMIIRVLSRSTFSPVKAIAAGPMITGGQVQRYATPVFVTGDVVEVEKTGTRKPGAPLLQPPGRRRARPRI